MQEFHIELRAERIVVPDSVRAALQQAVLIGVTEVTAIVRQCALAGGRVGAPA